MATIKKIERKRGTAYKIAFINPDTKQWTSKVVHCSYAEALKIKARIGKFGMDNPNQRKYLWCQLLEKYKKYSKCNKSQKTVDREEFVFDVFNNFLKGDEFIHKITTERINTYKQKRLKDDNKKPATVSIELRVLKTVFNKAIEWKMMKDNPVKGIKLPKSEEVKVRFLTIDEVNALKEAIEKDNNRPFLRLILAYLNTGARRNELLGPQFTWDDVYFDERKIMIKGNKGEDNRYVFMNDTLYNILAEIKEENPEVPFVSFKPYFVSHKIKEYYKVAGITGANLHSLRKTFGSLLLQSGEADLYTVSKLLGHKNSVRTTERFYVDLLDENYRSSVQALDTILTQGGKKPPGKKCLKKRNRRTQKRARR